jgi:hypothetical protein
MRIKVLVFGLLFVVFLIFSLGYADVPQMINYQGKITTPAGALVDTTVQIIFTIYDDSTSGNTLWADTVSSVSVQKGIFSVLLGSGNPIPDSVFDGNIRYLGTKVGTDAEMSPRKAMVSVAYAFRTAKVDTAEYAISADPDTDWDIDTAGINVYRLTGNVGIGMPVPQYKLDVGGTTQMTGFKMPTGAGIGEVLTSDANGVGTWQVASGGGGGWVDDGDVVRLQTSTDSVGIGTSNPGASLQIGGGSHAPVFLNTDVQIDHDDASSHRIEIRNNNGATGWSIDASGTTTFGPISATKDLHLLGGNSVRMTIDGTSGDVGIGTTSPDAPLQVGSGTHAPVLVNTSVQIDHDDASEHNVEIRNNNGATGWRINASGATTFGPLSAGQDLYLLGGNSTRMTINGTSGNVGIGTTDPKAGLHIVPDVFQALTAQRNGEVHISMKAYGSSSYPIFSSLRGRGTSASPAAVQNGDELLICMANGQYDAISSRTGGHLAFEANQTWSNSASGTRIVFDGVNDNSTSTSEWMRLVNGNVRIGTTSPTGKLDVNDDDIRIRSSRTPGSSTAAGYTGEIAWDASYIYICISGDGPGGSTDYWKRAALSTW